MTGMFNNMNIDYIQCQTCYKNLYNSKLTTNIIVDSLFIAK